MFFPNYIDIRRGDRVLDVGSGAYPYRRADVLCDKFNIGDDQDCLEQCGRVVTENKKPFHRIVDNKLPFGFDEFDLATCACVLEHVPVDDLPKLVDEIARVSCRQYIEVPKPFYDSVYNISPHLNLCDILDDGTIIVIDKKNTDLRVVSEFNKWAWEMRLNGTFSLDSHPRITAVGMMYGGYIPVRIIEDADEFWALVRDNKYFCKPPTFAWKVMNRLFPK